MSESFYNYLAKELIYDYFKNNPIRPGSRYTLFIENKTHYDNLIKALKDIGEEIIISDIYGSNSEKLTEEPYRTFYLKYSSEATNIIIAQENATEDYLTTLRNAIGIDGCEKYSNFGLLFILHQSSLSSIVSSCIDMQGISGPLNTNRIITSIKKKSEKIINNFELEYLTSYLDSLADYIEDGNCTLFDFQYAFDILDKETLKNNFSEIGFFNDPIVYDSITSLSKQLMKQRINENKNMFQKINKIMQQDDREENEKLLNKIIDEKLTYKILKSDNWKNEINYNDVLSSVKTKEETANFEFIDYNLENKGIFVDIIRNLKGNKKKSTNFIIICDETKSDNIKLFLNFNKKVSKPDKKETDDCFEYRGKTVCVNVGNKIISKKFGLKENSHEFIIIKVPFGKSFFADVIKLFSISKKGEIIITLPEDKTQLFLGSGITEISLPINNKIEWNSNNKLIIPLDIEYDDNKICFSIIETDKTYKFIIKLNSLKPIPPLTPDFADNLIWNERKTFCAINTNETEFYKIKCEEERSIVDYWRKFLKLEKYFVNNNILFIDNFIDEDVLNQQEFKQPSIPEKILNNLHMLYDYFRKHNTVPSLAYINDELENLYKNYYLAVLETIEQIPNNRHLSKEELNITKIGVVKEGKNLYFSPFHPLIVAYYLEFKKKYTNTDNQNKISDLLSPYYLLPYIPFEDEFKRPFTDSKLKQLKKWLFFEPVKNWQREKFNNITKTVVADKIDEFIHYFGYLFQDSNCPIVLNSIGIEDDTNLIIGIINYIKKAYKTGIQKIELHEYVSNITKETFFEKLNRLNSTESIKSELESLKVDIESKDSFTSQEIIHQLFTNVVFYKHSISNIKKDINNCHISFYQMNTNECKYVQSPSNIMRCELSLGGLISVDSTTPVDDNYYIGFGTGGLNNSELNDSYIYPMAIALNNIYANSKDDGLNQYHKNICIAKVYPINKSIELSKIYESSNWVTFLNPEVDINFFYGQDLYIVHFTDQYSINAKYDSITVTKRIQMYENMISLLYHNPLTDDKFKVFCKTMLNYFNCLNGNWLLSIVNKTENQIREKMSIVSSCIAMSVFMKRIPKVIWIPVSLEEILRVSGSIHLPQEFIFTKKDLGIKGEMSDDLLMLGLDYSSSEKLRMYIYPVEVKASENSSLATKGVSQVCQTYKTLYKNLFGEINFNKKFYRAFFASQYLTNAEKLKSNKLIPEADFNIIEKLRCKLLNVCFDFCEVLPNEEIGQAALVSFYSDAIHSLKTTIKEDVAVCQIHFSLDECIKFVSEPSSSSMDFLKNDDIIIDAETKKFMSELKTQKDKYLDDSGIESVEVIEDPIDNSVDIVKTEEKRPQTNNTLDTSNSKEVEKNKNEILESSNDSSGIKIKIGYVENNQYRPLYFEPCNTSMVSHPNIGIIGTMGTGKTQLARSIIAQFSKENKNNVNEKNVGILVFDYKGDYKDDNFLKSVNGECFKFNFPFNPLKLFVNKQNFGMNLPAITADRISDSFAKAYNLGQVQQNIIKQIIIKVYDDFGINSNPETWSNTVPTINDVVNKYFQEKNDVADKTYALFDKLRDYSIFTQNNDNCISLFEWLNGVKVIDLTQYPDDTKKVIVSLILDLFYAEMQQLGESEQIDGLRQIRVMIMVDEAHQFLKKKFNSLRKIISEGRMFGVGMMLSTQNISDFDNSDEDYSSYIASWIIHQVTNITSKQLDCIFGSGEKENYKQYMETITNAKIFESICKIGRHIEKIKDLPYYELIEKDSRFRE